MTTPSTVSCTHLDLLEIQRIYQKPPVVIRGVREQGTYNPIHLQKAVYTNCTERARVGAGSSYCRGVAAGVSRCGVNSGAVSLGSVLRLPLYRWHDAAHGGNSCTGAKDSLSHTVAAWTM